MRGRVPIHVDLPRPELAHWHVHVLKELGGLREEIRQLERVEERRALAMVFSSILTKVGKQRSETHEEVADRTIRKGLTTELFLRKATELAERWEALAEVAEGPPPDVIEGDARQLARLVGGRRFDLVLTSPPYGGTYDYAAHHARRMAWLELDDTALRRLELGARRRMGFDDAKAHWDQEVSEMLRALRSVLRPDGGSIVLVMGDAVVADQLVTVPDQLERLAPDAGLQVVGVASQPRHAGREEHIVWLRRA